MTKRRYSGSLLVSGMLCALAACAEPRLSDDVFIVLPNEDGSVGAITVSDGKSSSVLDKPLAAAQIDRDGKLKPAEVTNDDVSSLFGGALNAQPILPRRFVLYFKIDSDELTDASVTEFEKVFADVDRRPGPSVEVVGHTDTTGEQVYNAGLSLERASAIQTLLVERGIKADAITTAGRGELDLLVATDDERPEPRNRRVEITVR